MKDEDISLFSFGLLTLAASLFTVNICSLLGFCPKNCSLVPSYQSNQDNKCVYINGIHLSAILLGMIVTSLISLTFVIKTETKGKKFELPEFELPEIEIPELPEIIEL